MINQELLAYVRGEIAHGTPAETIKSAAVSAGWPAVEVNQAVVIATHERRPVEPATPVAPVAPPQEPAAIFVPPPSTTTNPPLPVQWPVIAGAVAVLVLVGGGLAYAYNAGIGPFKVSQYTEQTLLSGLLAKASEINTASYTFSVSLKVNPREEGATPFVVPVPDPALDDEYYNDSRRMSDVSTILNALKYQYGEQQTYDYTKRMYVTKPGKPYPATLTAAQMKALGNSYSTIRGADPATGKVYTYASTDSGKNFALTVTFETSGAISAIKRSYYGYAATTTPINGKTVTFTKDSSAYIYLPSEAPAPFLSQLADWLRSLPADVSGTVALGATTDFSKKESADWRFTTTADGDFGDLSYKVDVEAQKKDKNYYIRINKMPSIIPWFANYKGQWIVITPTSASSTEGSYNEFSFLSSSISSIEDQYKKDRSEFTTTLKDVAALADKDNVFAFKAAPTKESVDGRTLYRYDLTLRKESVIQFYKDLLADADKYKAFAITQDDGLLEYLQSKDFDDMFSYIDNNTYLSLYTDGKGFPAQVTYRIRIVPPDTALQLKDKQIDLVFTGTLKDVNQPVQIEVPSDAKTVEQVVKELDENSGSSLSNARAKGNDAAIKSNLDTIRTQGAIYYDSHSNYGTQTRVVGGAASCIGGMFKDQNVASALAASDRANGDYKDVLCYAYGTGFIAGADLATKGWWCVDSAGASVLETGSVSSAKSVKECP